MSFCQTVNPIYGSINNNDLHVVESIEGSALTANTFCHSFLICSQGQNYLVITTFAVLCTLSIIGLCFVALTIIYNKKL